MRPLKISQKLTDRNDETFKQYLSEISQIKPFDLNEENICARKAFSGDKKALDELVKRNLRFVISVAKQYSNENIPLQDLVNEGNIGLMIAAKKFDPNKGYKFISFAVWWIRKIIIQHISDYGKMIRLPANKINNVSKLDKQRHILEQKMGSKVDIVEVINHFDTINETIDNDTFKDYLLTDQLCDINIDSMDSPIYNEDDGFTLADTLESNFGHADQLINDFDIKSEINSVLKDLKPMEKKVIESLFGLNGKRPMTLKEVGEEPDINITRERVRQIRNKAFNKLEKNKRIQSVFEMI